MVLFYFLASQVAGKRGRERLKRVKLAHAKKENSGHLQWKMKDEIGNQQEQPLLNNGFFFFFLVVSCYFNHVHQSLSCTMVLHLYMDDILLTLDSGSALSAFIGPSISFSKLRSHDPIPLLEWFVKSNLAYLPNSLTHWDVYLSTISIFKPWTLWPCAGLSTGRAKIDPRPTLNICKPGLTQLSLTRIRFRVQREKMVGLQSCIVHGWAGLGWAEIQVGPDDPRNTALSAAQAQNGPWSLNPDPAFCFCNPWATIYGRHEDYLKTKTHFTSLIKIPKAGFNKKNKKWNTTRMKRCKSLPSR